MNLSFTLPGTPTLEFALSFDRLCGWEEEYKGRKDKARLNRTKLSREEGRGKSRCRRRSYRNPQKGDGDPAIEICSCEDHIPRDQGARNSEFPDASSLLSINLRGIQPCYNPELQSRESGRRDSWSRSSKRKGIAINNEWGCG